MITPLAHPVRADLEDTWEWTNGHPLVSKDDKNHHKEYEYGKHVLERLTITDNGFDEKLSGRLTAENPISLCVHFQKLWKLPEHYSWTFVLAHWFQFCPVSKKNSPVATRLKLRNSRWNSLSQHGPTSMLRLGGVPTGWGMWLPRWSSTWV